MPPRLPPPPALSHNILIILIELVLGRVLGRGGFCVVNEIKDFDLNASGAGAEHEKDSPDKDMGLMRGFLKKYCIRDGDCRYAIKKLSPESHTDQTLFLKGTVDMAVEARFLANMEHPHIVKMRGTGSSGEFESGFYIILDRLFGTLEDRIRKWKKAETKTKGVIGKMVGGKKKLAKLQLEKAHVVFDLATGMKYLHEHNIIYRDLKPENIGFDVRGDPKIFDFGLAKQLTDDISNGDGTYKLTGFTGSMRYMAPEIAKSLPYNLSADIYSFGMLFWEIFANEPPFITYSMKMHNELVIHKGYRPVVDDKWPFALSDIMKKCWKPEFKDRPDFTELTNVLSDETLRMSPDEDGQGAFLDLDISRRSRE